MTNLPIQPILRTISELQNLVTGGFDLRELVVSEDAAVMQLVQGVLAHAETLFTHLYMGDIVSQLRNALQTVRTADMKFGEVGWMAQGILESIITRFDSEVLLRLSSRAVLAYKADKPFGDSVLSKFPSTQDDVIEATRCLALDRYTASVFHLMRVMEEGVRSICRRFSIPDADWEGKTWGQMLGLLRPKVQALPTGDEKTQYLEVMAHLSSVKDAWRNQTMHPERVYTEEQATRVYNNVKDFMGHLAGII